MLMIKDNATEDRMPSTARLLYAGLGEDAVVELLEVRELVPAGSIRLGEMTILVQDKQPVSMTISPCKL